MDVRKRVSDVFMDLVKPSTLNRLFAAVISVPLIASAFALYNGYLAVSSVILFLVGSSAIAMIPRLALLSAQFFIKHHRSDSSHLC